MNRDSPLFRVAVIGAGIAGATCARALSHADLDVRVVDRRVKPAVGWRPGGHGLQTAADLPAVNEVPAS